VVLSPKSMSQGEIEIKRPLFFIWIRWDSIFQSRN